MAAARGWRLAGSPPPQAVLRCIDARRQYLHEGGFEAARISGNDGSLTAQLGTRRARLVAAAGGALRSRAGTPFTLSNDGEVLTVNEAGVRRESCRRLPPFTPSAADEAALVGLSRHAQLGATLTRAQTATGPSVQFNAPGGEVVPLQWIGPGHLARPNFLLRAERDERFGFAATSTFTCTASCCTAQTAAAPMARRPSWASGA